MPGIRRRYAYDGLYRLTSVIDPSNATVEAFTYDATGNRLSKQVGAAPPATYVYAGSNHRLASVAGITRSYDADGNTTAIGSTTALGFDDRNRYTTLTSNGALVDTYNYSGRGERVSKLPAGGAATLFGYNESGQLLGEYDATGAALKEYVWLDNAPVAIFDPTNAVVPLTYVESDHLGSPRIAVDPTRNVAVWSWSLLTNAFGEHAPNGDPDGDGQGFVGSLRFPGQYFDAESGLNYNYFRDYESGTGRYVESDPIGLAAENSTYGYVGGNPFRYIDARGLMSDSTCCEKARIMGLHEKDNQRSGGGVICCGGRKVSCVWDPKIRDPQDTGAAIIFACMKNHEDCHVPQRPKCSNCDDGTITRPGFPDGGGGIGIAECIAYKCERRCLRGIAGGCGNNQSCADWVRRRYEQVQEQINARCEAFPSIPNISFGE